MPMTVSGGGQARSISSGQYAPTRMSNSSIQVNAPWAREMLPPWRAIPSSRWYEMKMWRWPLMTAGASDSRSEVTATA